MNLKLIRSYRSKNGNPTFVYEVSGSKEELEAYEKAQGDFYRTGENGAPLWFTTRCIGDRGKLLITSNGKVVPDMSEFDQLASLSRQYGGNFGEELARVSAQRLLGGKSTPSSDDSEPKGDGGI